MSIGLHRFFCKNIQLFVLKTHIVPILKKIVLYGRIINYTPLIFWLFSLFSKKGCERQMFKYKKVMIAAFVLYFLSISIHTIFSVFNLEGPQRAAAIICGSAMFFVPMIIAATGKLRSFMPFILTTFYIAAAFLMSAFNKTAIYLPLIFACEAVISGFFLSSKLCVWLLFLSDTVLILNGALFLPPDSREVTPYIIMCLCYNFSAVGMAIFVYALQSNLSSYGRKNKELSRSNDRKSMFLAASAAKMRDSAEDISEVTASTLMRNDISAPTREKLRKIQTDTGRLLMILNDAEDYAKIESKTLVLINEPYSFNGLVSDIANFCSAACADKSISFSLDCGEDIPSVLIGDSRRISKIVMNLFSNAVKFTEEGTVTLSFSARRSEDGKAYLRIQVRDTGKGLTPDAARKIFTVYADKDGDTPKIHLGLGMVKQLVTLMGGFVFAGREQSGGTRFIVTIPQEIENPRPFATVEQPEKYHALIYFKNDGSAEAAQRQLDRLKISSRICLTRSDFMREKENNGYTHIFADYGYYLFDKPIFAMLSRRLKVVVLCAMGKGGERNEISSTLQKNVTAVFKPVHVAMLASVFNNSSDGYQLQTEFSAPDAKVLVCGEGAEKLKALSLYGINADFVPTAEAKSALNSKDYDMAFLAGKTAHVSVHIPDRSDRANELPKNLPVIAVGEKLDGCTAYLPASFRQWELGRLLLDLLPEEKIRYGEAAAVPSEYSELNPTRGILNAGGKKSAYKEMLEIFNDRTENLTERLEERISAGDFDGCITLLNSVKDVIAGIGATSTAEITRQTASAAGVQDSALLEELSHLLKAKLNRLKDDIVHYCISNNIQPMTEEAIAKARTHLAAAIDSENQGLAIRLTEDLLNMYMTFSQRLIVRSIYDSINSGSYDKALTQFERLEKPKIKEGGKQ